MDIKNISFSKNTVERLSRNNPVRPVVPVDPNRPTSIDPEIQKLRQDEINKGVTPTIGLDLKKKPFRW